MPYYNKVQLKHLVNSKYGPNHQGLFAVEKIYKGEHLIYEEDEVNEIWPFYPHEDKRGKYTKTELLKLIEDHPQLESIIYNNAHLIDDDLYNAPFKYANENFDNIDEHVNRFRHSLFMNHSCDPNTASISGKRYALRDIEVGEEITFDYACVGDAANMQVSIKCQCGSSKCRQTIVSNAYEDPKWQQENKDSCSPYILKKIEELRQKQNT